MTISCRFLPESLESRPPRLCNGKLTVAGRIRTFPPLLANTSAERGVRAWTVSVYSAPTSAHARFSIFQLNLRELGTLLSAEVRVIRHAELSGAAPGARRQAVLPNAPWRLQRKVAAKAAQAFVAVKARAGMT